MLRKRSTAIICKALQNWRGHPDGISRKDQRIFEFSGRHANRSPVDLSWHAIDPTDINDVKANENKAFEPTKLYPDVPENCMSTAFSHIFQGGYSAGYYSYKWAEVLDADAFEYFSEKGIFSKEVADKFKNNILSMGGTEHPMTLYKRFRGKEPQPEALLKRAGLIEK